jgi:hypothetical protein
VRCAIKSGIIKDYEEMNEQRVKEDDYDCFIFCHNHKAEGISIL